MPCGAAVLTPVVRYLLLSTEFLDALPPPKPKMDE